MGGGFSNSRYTGPVQQGRPGTVSQQGQSHTVSQGPSTADMGRLPTSSPTTVFRKSGREMRPSQEIRATPHTNVIERIRRVTKTIVTNTPLENFIPRKTSRNLTTSCTDNELDRSSSRTGPEKIENPHDVIEIDTATVGAPYPTKMNKPVAMADVAGASSPAVAGASGPVVTGTRCIRRPRKWRVTL